MRADRSLPLMLGLFLCAGIVTVGAMRPVLSAGTISFAPAVNYADSAGGAGDPLTTADFDNDGRLDLAQVGGTKLSLFWGRSNGTFEAAVGFPAPGGEIQDIETDDFNNDGLADLAVAHSGGNKIDVYLNVGARSFAPLVAYTVGAKPYGVATGDLNEDGWADLASANDDGHNLTVLLNNQDGTFRTGVTIGGGSYPSKILMADFNSDGHLDLANASYTDTRVYVAFGNGQGGFSSGAGFNVGGSYPSQVVAADFNGDGKLDLATANYFGGNVSVLTGSDDGAFPAMSSYAAGSNPYAMAPGDVDGDGSVDLVVPNGDSGKVSVLRNDGTGAFEAPVQFTADGTGVRTAVVGDFNGDGKLDAATGNGTKATVSVFLNDGPAPVLPAAPTFLRARALSYDETALRWRDNAINEDGYEVLRRDPGGVFAPVGTVGPGVTTFTDDGLIGSTPYIYQVRSFNASGSSSRSPQAQVTTLLGPPAAPSDLQGTAVSAFEIDLTWADGDNQESGFSIEAKSGDGEFGEVGTTDANVTSFAHTGLTENTLYTYRVRAVNAVGVSDYSEEISVGTLILPPAVPTQLKVTLTSATSLMVTWRDGSTDETSFELQRSTDGGAGWLPAGSVAPLAGTGGLARSRQEGLTTGVTYTFRVRAMKGDSPSDWVGPVSIVLGPPAAPTALKASSITTSSMRISWLDNAGNESYFRLERSTDGGATWPVIYQLPARAGVGTVASYLDTSLAEGAVYTYRVAATNPVGVSAYAGPASFTTAGRPAAPSDLKAVALSTTRIKLTWVDNAGNEQRFRVERSTDGGATWPTEILVRATAGSGITVIYYDSNLTPATTYTYRVRASNTAGASGYNANGPQSARTLDPPAAPTDLNAVRYDSTTLIVTWQDNAITEAGFKLERSTDGGATWPVVINVGARAGANLVTVRERGLTTGVTYNYRVRAYNDGIYSVYSNTAAGTP
jgi:hypothetical protein